MTVEHNTRAIVALAWGRRLDLGSQLADRILDPDVASAPGTHPVERIESVTGFSGGVSVVSLFGQLVVRGPAWFVERSRDIADAELINESTLLELTRDHQGRAIGQALLSFADHPRQLPGDQPLALGTDQGLAVRLESVCPPDDVAEVGLSTMDQVLVVDGEPPSAGAGFDVWEGLLAHLGVLVAPDRRHAGLGTRVAAAALEEACAQGLVGQWRASVLNPESQRIADRLGFELAGSQTSIELLG